MSPLSTSIRPLRIAQAGERALLSKMSASSPVVATTTTQNAVTGGAQQAARRSTMAERRTRSAASSPPGTPNPRHSMHSTSSIHFPTLGLLKSLSSAAHTNVPMSNAELLEEAATRKKGHEDVERRKRYLVNGLLGHHQQSTTPATAETAPGSSNEQARGRSDRTRTQKRSSSLSGLVGKRRTLDEHVPSPLANEMRRPIAQRSLHTTSATAAPSSPRPGALDTRAATVTAAELTKLRANQPDLETGSSSHPTTQQGAAATMRSGGPSVATIATDLSSTAQRSPMVASPSEAEPPASNAADPQLSPRHQQILESSTELFCSRPTNAIFDRDWRDDAIFEDPLAYCKGRHEWSAQWFGMPKAFPQSRQLEYRIVSATGGPGQPGQLQYEQTQEYTIAGLGTKKIMKSLVVIDLDADEKIVHFQDRWDGKPLGKRFGKYFAKRLNAKVMPWVISVPKKE